MTAVATLAPTCEARVGFYAGEFSEQPLWCQARIGLTVWPDREGTLHRACRHHLAGLLLRYPEPPPAAECVLCKRPLEDGLYGLFTTATSVAPVCTDCQEKGS